MRGVPRRPPQARGAGGEDRRRGHLHVHPPQRRRRLGWFADLHEKLTATQNEIAKAILKEINERLGFLHNVGLDYLHLDRTSGTLSGGESQRIRLASQIGSGLSGVLYVLDEPSIGLHQKDNDRLLETLKRLQSASATPCSSSSMTRRRSATPTMSSTWAPAPESTAARSSARARSTSCSPAGQPHRRLPHRPPRDPAPHDPPQGQRQVCHRPRRDRQQPPVRHRRLPARHLHLRHRGQRSAASPSLTIDTLYAGAARTLNGARIPCGPCSKITGLEQLDKVIDIDQSPIGRTPRSNPATYTGAFTQIRDWFAGLPESKARGYKPGRF